MSPEAPLTDVEALAYIELVHERRIVKADHHALPLLFDIIDSTTHLLSDQFDVKQIIKEDLLEREPWSGKPKGEYFIGFEEHFPYGFIGFRIQEDSGEVAGPYLYRDYLGRNYGGQMLAHVLEIARSHDLKLLFLLAPKAATWAVNFFTRHEFEVLSDNTAFIKRWHDGLLADRAMSEDVMLLVCLLEIED